MKLQPLRLLVPLLLAGCSNVPSGPALESAREQLLQARASVRAQAVAPQDLVRADESLARARQLSDYWGTDDDARQQALLSQRYSQIALARGQLDQERVELEHLQQQREQLQRLLVSVRREPSRLQQQIEGQLLPLGNGELANGLTLPLEDALFDAGSSELLPEGNLPLLRVHHFLREHPQVRLRIESSVCGQDSVVLDQQLAAQRAQALVDVLAEMGIDAGRLEAQGLAGMQQPGTDAPGAQTCQRVELVFSALDGHLPARR